MVTYQDLYGEQNHDSQFRIIFPIVDMNKRFAYSNVTVLEQINAQFLTHYEEID